jgi:hypothetical protein
MVTQSVYRLGYRLGNQGSVPGKGNDGISSLCCHVQTSSGAHPTSYPMDTGGALTPGVKWPGHEVDHLLPPSAKVKNVWSYTSTSPVGLHGVVLHEVMDMSSWCGT